MTFILRSPDVNTFPSRTDTRNEDALCDGEPIADAAPCSAQEAQHVAPYPRNARYGLRRILPAFRSATVSAIKTQ